MDLGGRDEAAARCGVSVVAARSTSDCWMFVDRAMAGSWYDCGSQEAGGEVRLAKDRGTPDS